MTPNAAWDSKLPWTGGIQVRNCSMVQHPSLQCAEAYAPDSQTHFRLFWLNQRMLQVRRHAASFVTLLLRAFLPMRLVSATFSFNSESP